jgi:hypothetical protein
MIGSLALARVRTRWLVPLLVLSVGLTLALVAAPAFAATATLKEEHKGSTNPGFETGDCPTNPDANGNWGWHFVLQGSDTDFNSLTATFETAGNVSAQVIDGKHAYVFTPGPDKLLDATADVTGPDTDFNLSHVCTGTTTGGGGNGGGNGAGGDGGSVEVGGVTAERPGGAAAASAVTSQPRFTG